MSDAKEAELKILAVARFVDENFTADLIRKSDVVALLKWTARGVNKDAIEIPKAWVDDQLEHYGHTDEDKKQWLQKNPQLTLIK